MSFAEVARFLCRREDEVRKQSELMRGPNARVEGQDHETSYPGCPHCGKLMKLVHNIDRADIPEILVFYCAACKRAETKTESMPVAA
jgi:hypothetical protein